jgi:hypothetical protein
MQGFKLTTVAMDGVGGDLDITTLAVDSDDIIRDAIVCAVRTRVSEWYYNPATGLDPEAANLSPLESDIKATIEADLADMLATTAGATFLSGEATRITTGTGRDWTLRIRMKTNRSIITINATASL